MTVNRLRCGISTHFRHSNDIGDMPSRFSSISEAFASEFLEYLEEMCPIYWLWLTSHKQTTVSTLS